MDESHLAKLILFPNRFQIAGPGELIGLTLAIVENKSYNNDEMKYHIETLWSDWYIICAVTGEKIPLDQLRYWDIHLQECYKSPDVVPNRYWTQTHDPRPELRDYWVKHNPERIAP
jgi:hypothetical protein